MKHLFDRLAGLRPPSELGWVGTVSAVFVIVSVVMILVYLAMAVAKADVDIEPKCSLGELQIWDGELNPDGTIDTIVVCNGKARRYGGVVPVEGCYPGTRA